jgi:glycosyltransferase involved in cell wall biosynthesis
MNKKKTLLFIIPKLGSGGAERVIANLCQILEDFEKYVIVFEKETKYEVKANIIHIPLLPSKNLLFRILNFLIIKLRLKKFKKKIKTSFTISIMEPTNYYNLFTKHNQEKIILTFHNHYSLKYSPERKFSVKKRLRLLFYKFIMKRFYNKADLLIAVSKGVGSDLVKNFGISSEKIITIYNPVLLEEIERLSKEKLCEYEDIFKHQVIITAGRLKRQKGQWYLLRIFKKLKEQHKDLKLLILGEGGLKEYLNKLSEELGLKTYVWDRDKLNYDFDVYFLGFQKNPFKFIARSELFVFPSLWEGLGNVIIEAMACGVPVISADCMSGPREILAPNTDITRQTYKPEFAEYGILMPTFEYKFKSADEPLDEKEQMWVDIIDKMLTDDDLRKYYAEKGKERVKDFQIEKIIREWEKVLT